jgi:hypothetical protein
MTTRTCVSLLNSFVPMQRRMIPCKTISGELGTMREGNDCEYYRVTF